MVAPIVVAAAITAAAQLAKKKGYGADQKRLDEALRQFSGLEVPTVEEQQVNLEKLVQQGVITAEEAEFVRADPSAFTNLNVDPTGRQAELQALDKLQGIFGSGGMDAQAKARLSQIQNEIGTSSRGAREAIMQNAAERGISGSGFELVNKMNEQQGSATRANQAAVQAAADAEQRALQAISQSGSLGGQVRGQDYAQESAKASAIDTINKFNTANRQDVLNSNVDRRNAANVTNLNARQRIADVNTAASNTNKLRNSDLIQGQYDNRIKKAAGASGQLEKLAASDLNAQNQRDKYTGELLSKGGELASSVLTYGAGSRKKKDDDDEGWAV